MMKKVFSLILVVVVAISLSVSAYAMGCPRNTGRSGCGMMIAVRANFDVCPVNPSCPQDGTCAYDDCSYRENCPMNDDSGSCDNRTQAEVCPFSSIRPMDGTGFQYGKGK